MPGVKCWAEEQDGTSNHTKYNHTLEKAILCVDISWYNLTKKNEKAIQGLNICGRKMLVKLSDRFNLYDGWLNNLSRKELLTNKDLL